MSASTAAAQPQFNWRMRILHWLTAAMVLTMLGIGVAMVASLGDYHRLVSIHRPLGIAILIVVVIRFVNRQFSTLPPFPATMSQQERFAAHASEILLYTLLFVLPLVGWGMLSAARYPIVMFGSLHLFPILPHSVMLYAFLRKTHTVLAYLLFLAFIAHFGAVLFHTLIVQDHLFSRMAPWSARTLDEFRPQPAQESVPLPPTYGASPSPQSKLEPKMSERYSGQVALVAGGTGGLGRAVSLAFLEAGATVVVTYRRPDEFEALCQAAGARASRLEGNSIDVTNDAAVHQLVASIIAKHGKLDALVNAVGGYAAGQKLWEAEPATMDQMLSLNLYSGYVLCRSVVPAMLKLGRGAIVNVSSTQAIDHPAASAAYAASKAAAVAMIDSLAADLKGTGVRANSILPSIIDTDANRKAIPNADFSKWPKPQDIAQVILFLCSDAAKLIHGASIPV